MWAQQRSRAGSLLHTWNPKMEPEMTLTSTHPNLGKVWKAFCYRWQTSIHLLYAFPTIGKLWKLLLPLLLLIQCSNLFSHLISINKILQKKLDWSTMPVIPSWPPWAVSVTKGLKAKMILILIPLESIQTTCMQVQAVCSARGLGLSCPWKERTCLACSQKLCKLALLIGRRCLLEPQAIKRSET